MQEVRSRSWSKEILTNPHLLGIYLQRELMNNKFDHHHQLFYNNVVHEWVGQKQILPTIQTLYTLTDRLPSQIFLFALMHSPVYPGEMSKFFHRSKQVVHYNIQRLCAAGLLKEHGKIDQAVLAVIQKKARSRQDGTRKLSFYRVADLDSSLLLASVKLSIEVLGIDEARRIASYTRNFEKPDYRIHLAVSHIRRFRDQRKREIAILEWSRELHVSVERLREELRRVECAE